MVTHDLSVLRAGEAQVDAHALLLTCCVAIYMGFPFGMSTAATIRVGNLVGANKPAEARLSGPALAFQVVHLPFKFCLSKPDFAFRIVCLPFQVLHLSSSCCNCLFRFCTCFLTSALVNQFCSVSQVLHCHFHCPCLFTILPLPSSIPMFTLYLCSRLCMAALCHLHTDFCSVL